jgi:hypothetical protein
MNTRPLLFAAAFAILLPGCANFEDVVVGTWSCSDGGQVTFAEDGTGTTTCDFFVDFCSGEGPYGITWVYDGNTLDVDVDAEDCGGTASVNFPVLDFSSSRFTVGIDIPFVGESVVQTFTSVGG